MTILPGTLECLRYIGAGNSPTLEYDRYVVSEALNYLKNDHEIPQFLCVGTYGPHHPYVAPKELYEYLSGEGKCTRRELLV